MAHLHVPPYGLSMSDFLKILVFDLFIALWFVSLTYQFLLLSVLISPVLFSCLCPDVLSQMLNSYVWSSFMFIFISIFKVPQSLLSVASYILEVLLDLYHSFFAFLGS